MQRLFLRHSPAARCTLGFIHLPIPLQSLQTRNPKRTRTVLRVTLSPQRGAHLGEAINESAGTLHVSQARIFLLFMRA